MEEAIELQEFGLARQDQAHLSGFCGKHFNTRCASKASECSDFSNERFGIHLSGFNNGYRPSLARRLWTSPRRAMSGSGTRTLVWNTTCFNSGN